METVVICLVGIAINLLLLLIGLKIFMPKKVFGYKKADMIRILSKYKFFIFCMLMVWIFQLIEVNLVDEPLTRWVYSRVGEDFFAKILYSIEGNWAWNLVDFWQNPLQKPLLYYFVFFYFFIYAFGIWFIPLLFLLNDREWHTKLVLLYYPLIWLIQLPFLLFFPVTNVYKFLGIESAIEMLIPGIESAFYTLTTVNNCFPSVHVAFVTGACVVAFLSENKKLKWFTLLLAGSIGFGVFYLAIHWILDIIAGIFLAALAGFILYRSFNPQAKALGMIRPTFRGKKG